MALTECWECGDSVSTSAEVCPHCGAPDPAPDMRQEGGEEESAGRSTRVSGRSSRGQSEKSDGLAAVLGLALGPVGLWYKRQWAAGFAWLAGAVILGAASGGLLAPVLWVGMAVHAYSADAK